MPVTTKPTDRCIGTTVRDRKVQKAYLTPEGLLSTHTALIASSGGGKSQALRLILEETFGLMPHIVIDVEGELRTLREKYDYIIASADEDGDVLAHPKSARLLARRLLELNASCIIDISELKPDQKVEFVKEFVHALINAPKKLLVGQRLIVIDEAQEFCPETKSRGMASRDELIDGLSRGRKRGLNFILASQRLAKVSKDALSECRNKFYGFCNLLADRKRAMEDLGFTSKKDQELFRALDVGQFYAVGPAISKREVIKVQFHKKTKTTHPHPGSGILVHTPPPKTKVKKLLKGLQDLPEQAKKEAKDLREAQLHIKGLEAQIRSLERSTKAGGASEADIKKARSEGFQEGQNVAIDAWQDQYNELLEQARLVEDGQALIEQNIHEAANRINDTLLELKNAAKEVRRTTKVKARKAKAWPRKVPKKAQSTPAMTVVRAAPHAEPIPMSVDVGDYSGITGGAKRLVEVLVNCRPARFTKPQWGSLANLKHTSGTFSTYLSKLRTAGLVSEENGLFAPTPEAVAWIGDNITPPQNNGEVVEMWCNALGGTPAKMIRVLRGEFPDDISREEMGEQIGVSPTSGTFSTYLSKLRSNGLVEVNGQNLRAGDPLLWEHGMEMTG